MFVWNSQGLGNKKISTRIKLYAHTHTHTHTYTYTSIKINQKCENEIRNDPDSKIRYLML
jgi:hypothetical protein